MIRNRFDRRTARLHLEHLEDRSVPSTFTVNTTLDDVTPANGKFSLREAITKANTTAGADVIVLPAGVFKITQAGAGDDGNLTGDFDITHNLTIQGAGAGVSIVDGQQLDRVFDVLGSGPSSIKVVFAGLTVRNGGVTGDGGGIRAGNTDLVVSDSVVSGNRASVNGGGISDPSGTGNVTLVRSTVGRNVAGRSGGGVEFVSNAPLTVKDSTVRRNIAVTGGGIATSTATLTNSIVSGNSAPFGGVGGGIYATHTATLTNSTVSGNSASAAAGSTSLGGGIYADIVTLTNSTVSGNSASATGPTGVKSQGGGIFALRMATLTNSTVSRNSASGPAGVTSEGGGIHADMVTLTNSTVSGNSAGLSGGGIWATAATATNSIVSDNSAGLNGGGVAANRGTLTNCTISGNRAASFGGGISITIATLTNCTVSGNSADLGGGIGANTATLTNSTVSGNTATTQGGGMWVDAAALINCTVVENSSHTAGGVFHRFPGGTFSVRNTIIALNLVDFAGTDPDVSGDFLSQGHNLIGDHAGSNWIGGTGVGDLMGTATVPADPMLGPLVNNGGKTKTHALLAGSPAIDHGDNVGALATDQRGFARKKDGNGDGLAVVDIGAFEK